MLILTSVVSVEGCFFRWMGEKQLEDFIVNPIYPIYKQATSEVRNSY